MPAAIRMANGYTYYPGGFEHVANSRLRITNPNSTKTSSGNRESEYMRRYNMYGQYWADKGEDPVPHPDPNSPIKWVSKEYAARIENSMRQGKYHYAGSGKVGNFIKNAPHKMARNLEAARDAAAQGIKQEGLNVKSGWEYGTRTYDREKGSNGNAFGRTMAGVKNAAKATTAYKVGKAAVTKAGEMLSKGAGWVGDKAVKGYNKIKETAVGKAIGTAANAVVNAGKKVGGAVAGAGKRVGDDFKGIARAIGKTAIGKAALSAGKAALNAGGNAVAAVGGALSGIATFFKNKYTYIKNRIKSRGHGNQKQDLSRSYEARKNEGTSSKRANYVD